MALAVAVCPDWEKIQVHSNMYPSGCHSAVEPPKTNCQYVHFLFNVTFVLTKLTKIANFIS